MKVDVYKRTEDHDLCSYLIVPNQQALPEEVANTDWQVHELNVDFQRGDRPRFTLQSDDAFDQIGEKGYAISHLSDRSGDPDLH